VLSTFVRAVAIGASVASLGGPIMHLKPGFAFTPLPPAPIDPDPPYGPLRLLPGHWAGSGFNMIWRPFHDPNGKQDHYLELNLTNETIDFALIEGAIPNRGLLQDDINMYGITYLQQISDANLSTPDRIVGLHADPGVWAHVPATRDPVEPQTVVRMASIPHGAAIIAQGIAFTQEAGPALSEPGNDYPKAFDPRNPSQPFLPSGFTLCDPTPYRSSGKQIDGITQDMLDKPVETVLRAAIKGQTILSTVTMSVSTKPADKTDPSVSAGGGTANTAFLEGKPGRSNAQAAQVDSTFWIEHVRGESGEADFHQLQYRQVVYLQFGGFFWPHLTVATLRKAAD
jgi:hypothetical protein